MNLIGTIIVAALAAFSFWLGLRRLLRAAQDITLRLRRRGGSPIWHLAVAALYFSLTSFCIRLYLA